MAARSSVFRSIHLENLRRELSPSYVAYYLIRSKMLEARALTKRYTGVPAVSQVNFCIEPQQILGYLGPNGSGKSTTVKMLTGLLQPSEGRVLFRGEDIAKNLAAYKRHLGYVPEEANLYP